MLRVAARIAVSLLISMIVMPVVRGQEDDPSEHEISRSATYPLDEISRIVPERGRLHCDPTSLVTYRGTTLHLFAPVRVHAAFLPFVQRLEVLAREVGVEVYGRGPRSMAHAGAYSCRRIRRAPTTLSEHALGNAIDVRGFDFGSAERNAPTLPSDVPGRYARSFRVRVQEHWASDDPRYAVHVRFFERLRERLLAEPDLFTVMLGPSYPGHRNHMHLDRAPFRFAQF